MAATVRRMPARLRRLARLAGPTLAALIAGGCTTTLGRLPGDEEHDGVEAGADAGPLGPLPEPDRCGTDDRCAAGRDCCDERCVDLTIDVFHCGACGSPCGPGQACSAGECVVLAPMPTARTAAAATTGLDGRIYVLGGFARRSATERTYVTAAEVYDPGSNTWSAIAPLRAERGWSYAATGPDGRIYLIGGSTDGDAVLASVDVFDPATGQWRAAAPMATARTNFAGAVGADGRIYVFGGATAAPVSWHDRGEVYTPSADRWDPIAPLPSGRSSFAAATATGSTIVATGGWDGERAFDTTLVYSPDGDSWSSGPPLDIVYSAHAMARAPDGRLVLVGGLRDSFITSTTQGLADGAWSSLGSIGLARRSVALAVGRAPHALVYAIGGGDVDNQLMYNSFEAFSVSSMTWR